MFARAIKKLGRLRVVDTRELHVLHEQIHLGRLLDLLKVDCVFDVGANYGQYATMLRNDVGFRGLIISFEPIPRAAEHIRHLSNGDPRWRVEQLALSESSGNEEFHIMESTEFSSLGLPSHAEVNLFKDKNRVAETITVSTETLSSAFRRLTKEYQFVRPFLKLDTQGYDVEVLKSGQEVVQQFVGLQSELAMKKIYDRSVDFREAISFYESLGFELSAFVPNNSGHFPMLVEMDCIMVRRDLLSEASSGK